MRRDAAAADRIALYARGGRHPDVRRRRPVPADAGRAWRPDVDPRALGVAQRAVPALAGDLYRNSRHGTWVCGSTDHRQAVITPANSIFV